jgi:hypothetical protein
VTLINDNVGKVPPEAMPQLEQLARLAGARFVLRDIAYESEAVPGTSLRLKMNWANVGVGRLYRSYTLRFTLLDSLGKVCHESAGKADPGEWLPGEHSVLESVQLPEQLPAGEYRLAVQLADRAGLRRPFLLAIDAPEMGSRYVLGTVRIR